MRVRNRPGHWLLAATLFLTGVVIGDARIARSQPTEATPPASTHHQVPHADQLVHVKTCDPALNMMQSGGYMPGPYYGAYAPGWGYRGGYWGDVYGASYYQAPVTTANPQLGIDYVNVSHLTMSEIEFGLIVNGILRAEVKDVGTFSPHVEIKHKFGVSPNIFPIQSALPHCVPLRITFEDGTQWRNPALPPKNKKIYLNP